MCFCTNVSFVCTRRPSSPGQPAASPALFTDILRYAHTLLLRLAFILAHSIPRHTPRQRLPSFLLSFPSKHTSHECAMNAICVDHVMTHLAEISTDHRHATTFWNPRDAMNPNLAFIHIMRIIFALPPGMSPDVRFVLSLLLPKHLTHNLYYPRSDQGSHW